MLVFPVYTISIRILRVLFDEVRIIESNQLTCSLQNSSWHSTIAEAFVEGHPYFL